MCKFVLLMMNKAKNMVCHVEHIGLAVKDLAAAKATYARLLGVDCYKEERVESEGVTTAFFLRAGTKIELLAATHEGSPIAKFLEKRGEGMHHVAFEVEDIHAEMARLKAEGFTLLSEQPKTGADNKLVCFVHPRDNHGVLVELCQEMGGR